MIFEEKKKGKLIKNRVEPHFRILIDGHFPSNEKSRKSVFFSVQEKLIVDRYRVFKVFAPSFLIWLEKYLFATSFSRSIGGYFTPSDTLKNKSIFFKYYYKLLNYNKNKILIINRIKHKITRNSQLNNHGKI